MTPLLSLENIAVEISGRRALHDVVLKVPARGSVGIVGETGSGKSLTCRVATGLLHRIDARVVQGTATFEGAELESFGRAQWQAVRGRKIGFIPQASGMSLDPLMPIGKQLAETVAVLDPGANRKSRVLELLDMVRMPSPSDVACLHPHELSGGMRQRVMIALALAGRPRLLIADEATTALDVTIQRLILDLLQELRNNLEMALLVVTHDLSVVESVCDDVTVMYAGSTIERGPTQEVLSRPRHPYTRALVGARPTLTQRPGGQARLVAIPGAPPALGEIRQGCGFAPRCTFTTEECRTEDLRLTDLGGDHQISCRNLAEVPT